MFYQKFTDFSNVQSYRILKKNSDFLTGNVGKYNGIIFNIIVFDCLYEKIFNSKFCMVEDHI